jgi:hypothetical protein
LEWPTQVKPKDRGMKGGPYEGFYRCVTTGKMRGGLSRGTVHPMQIPNRMRFYLFSISQISPEKHVAAKLA